MCWHDDTALTHRMSFSNLAPLPDKLILQIAGHITSQASLYKQRTSVSPLRRETIALIYREPLVETTVCLTLRG
jgi:hypothetical protein